MPGRPTGRKHNRVFNNGESRIWCTRAVDPCRKVEPKLGLGIKTAQVRCHVAANLLASVNIDCSSFVSVMIKSQLVKIKACPSIRRATSASGELRAFCQHGAASVGECSAPCAATSLGSAYDCASQPAIGATTWRETRLVLPRTSKVGPIAC